MNPSRLKENLKPEIGSVGSDPNLDSSSNHHVEHHRPVSEYLCLSDVSVSLMVASLSVS